MDIKQTQTNTLKNSRRRVTKEKYNYPGNIEIDDGKKFDKILQKYREEYELKYPKEIEEIKKLVDLIC